ncbi:MAG: Uma2 family endonuclease [Cyanophyceae cyanobacterium]
MHTLPPQILYPDCDGEPISDNTRQFRWIVTVKEGLDYLFRADPNVFVAGDLLWYPVEGDPKIRVAPDALVVSGRPKGDRGSYRQWEEDGIPPQVVFEILSPGNSFRKMLEKLRFYERYGVQEYYLYDPDVGTLEGFLRQQDELIPIPEMEGWNSPRLGIRFGLVGLDLDLRDPEGKPFVSFGEALAQAEHERQRADLLAEKLRQLGVDPDTLIP